MTKKILIILSCVLFFTIIINIYQGCSNADLKEKIRQDKKEVAATISDMDLNLKEALLLSEKKRMEIERLEGEAEAHKKRADKIRVMSSEEVRKLRETKGDLQSKYDKLESDGIKKNEVIIGLRLTLSLKDKTISKLKLTVSSLEEAAKKTRSKISKLELSIEKWDSDYKLLLKKKTGSIFFGGFAGWGSNASGETYPTGGIGILWKWFKIK